MRSITHRGPTRGLQRTATPSRLLISGQKLHAIKLVREQSDLSLKDAKELVESWQSAPVLDEVPSPSDGASG